MNPLALSAFALYAQRQGRRFLRSIGSKDASSRIYFAKAAEMPGEDGRILDLGAGPCLTYGTLSAPARARYVGVDRCTSMFDLSPYAGSPERIVADLEAVPLPDRFARHTLLRHVLEHCMDFQPVLREAMRLSAYLLDIGWSVAPVANLCDVGSTLHDVDLYGIQRHCHEERAVRDVLESEFIVAPPQEVAGQESSDPQAKTTIWRCYRR